MDALFNGHKSPKKRERKHWQFHGDYGHSLRSMCRTNDFELRHDELITQPTEGNAPSKSSEDAKSKLWHTLQTNKLIATGIDAPAGKRVEIPAREFIDLDLRESEDELFLQGAETAAYFEVRLPSADIRRVWPKLSTRNASLAGAESKCVDWLEGLMKQSPDKPLAKRDSLMKQAREKFDGLSGEGFGRAWKKAINATSADAWSKPGPKPKSTGLKSLGQ